MLGHKLFQDFSQDEAFVAYATVRSNENLERWFSPDQLRHMLSGVDATRIDTVYAAIDRTKPDVVINCIGIIKQLPEAKNAVKSIAVNALFPHLVAEYCAATGTRVIHISTDCVFDGSKGCYVETDPVNANDLYGKTKQLGELVTYENAVTLRTSVIGHELKHHLSLIDWFMRQEQTVRGYTQAIYTGFPTIEFSHIIKNYVIPQRELHGLYHVASSPISKFELLREVADRYGKPIEIVPFDGYQDNKSLLSERFAEATGYVAPSWSELIDRMYRDYMKLQKEEAAGYENNDHCRNEA